MPSDRHRHAAACRHFPYHKPAAVPSAAAGKTSVKTAVEVPAGTFREAAVSEMVIRGIPEKRHSFHPVAAAVNRRKRIQEERNAEIDALISRRRYTPLELLLHPYDCMRNEAVQELPSSALSSLLRMMIRWLIASVLISNYFSSLVNYFDFSILRVNFTQTADTALRLMVMFMLCEMFFYFVMGTVSRFSRRPLSFGRLFAAGSMGWLAESAGYLIAGAIGLKYPLAAFAMMLGTVVFGLVLRNKTVMECAKVRVEIIAVVTAFCTVISAGFIFFWFGLTERSLIELLLSIYR